MSATFQAKLRDKVGSRGARKLRAEGQIPCNIQGGDGDHINFSIDEHAFFTARRQHEHLFDIELGGATETALVRELQWDSMGEQLMHIEFRRVVRGQKIESVVKLSFEGMPKSGILNHLMTEITISSIPWSPARSIARSSSGMRLSEPSRLNRFSPG